MAENLVYLNFSFDQYQATLGEVAQDVINDTSMYRGAEVMPTVQRGSNTIRSIVREAMGGLTLEHMLGTEPKKVQRPAKRSNIYAGGFYREAFELDEAEILFLTNFATLDFTDRGIREEMNAINVKGMHRVANRMEQLRWTTLFNGTWSWQGQTVDFGVPGGNVLTPSVAWTTPATAVPLTDIRNWVTVALRKYRVRRIWMNQVTANNMLATTQIANLLSAVGGRQEDLRNDPNALLKFHFPGAPEIVVYDGWYTTETETAGVISQSAPISFIPDNALYFEIQPKDNGKVGEISMTPNLQNGSIDVPGEGIIFATKDKSDDPGNPRMEFISGFNGAPRLILIPDIFTGDVS